MWEWVEISEETGDACHVSFPKRGKEAAECDAVAVACVAGSIMLKHARSEFGEPKLSGMLHYSCDGHPEIVGRDQKQWSSLRCVRGHQVQQAQAQS